MMVLHLNMLYSCKEVPVNFRTYRQNNWEQLDIHINVPLQLRNIEARHIICITST
jgi:hypothetical protein